MVHLIFKKSARELRERSMVEAPKWSHGQVDAYARDMEEADTFLRDEVGRDNPNRKGVLTDDGGKADREVRHRMLRSMGITNVEAYD